MKSLLLALLSIFATFGQSNAADKLYSAEVTQKSSEGKPLIMKFEEIKREKRTSTVKVTFKSGASVPSAMFIAKGCYEIAKERKAKFFINLKEWEDDHGRWFYLIGFSDTSDINLQRYFSIQPSNELDKDSFMSVKDCDTLFENN